MTYGVGGVTFPGGDARWNATRLEAVMNFSFLPTKIKEALEGAAGGRAPFSISRAGTALDGGSGETYLVAYDDKIALFSRSLGESSYSVVMGKFPDDLKTVSLIKDGAHAKLEYDLAGERGELEFSSFEEKNLRSIVDKWNSAVAEGESGEGRTPETEAAETEGDARSGDAEGALSPMEAMAAALMYVAAVDGEVAKEENRYINTLRGIDKSGLKKAYEYYREHSFDELFDAFLSGLSREQELCVLANMLDIGMSDGVLHRSETELASSFAERAGIEADEYVAVKQVLMVKNKISVLLT